MVLHSFASFIIAQHDGNTEHILPNDYRFDILRGMYGDCSKEVDERAMDVVSHKYIRKINGLIEFREGRVYYQDTEIASDILHASYRNYGDNRYLSAYINGFIEQVKKGKKEISLPFPYTADGTIWVASKISFEEMKKKYWSGMSKAPEKAILNLFRDVGVVNKIFLVGIFGGIWNPNQQVEAIAAINDSPFDKEMEVLDRIMENRALILKWFELDQPKTFMRICKEDRMWWDHIIEMCQNFEEIIKIQPEYKIPSSYPFNRLFSLSETIKNRLKGVFVRFDAYYQTYGFFEGLEILGYRVVVPSDSSVLSDVGSEMNICIGGDAYVRRLARSDGLIFIYYKDDVPVIAAELQGNGKSEIRGKDNGIIDKTISTEILRFMKAVLTKDRETLSTYVSHDFIANRLSTLRQEVGTKKFKQLEAFYKSPSKNSDNGESNESENGPSIRI